MRVPLVLHPQSSGHCVDRIEILAERSEGGRILLDYRVEGQIEALRLPPATVCRRRHGLWRHSCFEAFVRAPGETAYYELNFAATMEWAAYRFDGERSGMRDATDVEAPHIETRLTDESFALRAMLSLDALAGEATWRLGLSAVIEAADGSRSCWALAHPPGPPDFHHRDCFALELAASPGP